MQSKPFKVTYTFTVLYIYLEYIHMQIPKVAKVTALLLKELQITCAQLLHHHFFNLKNSPLVLIVSSTSNRQSKTQGALKELWTFPWLYLSEPAWSNTQTRTEYSPERCESGLATVRLHCQRISGSPLTELHMNAWMNMCTAYIVLKGMSLLALAPVKPDKISEVNG